MKIRLTPLKRFVPQGGLSALNEVQLCSRYQAMLDQAMRSCYGPASWRRRKEAEARDLLALAQISGRASVAELDVAETLRALVFLEVPVPCRSAIADRIEISPEAVLGLTYPEAAISLPQPGFAFVQLRAPVRVWHANVGPPELGQPLCLGTRLPTGIPLNEILVMSYGALSMQSVMIDEKDAAGVLNPDAARWWQQNLHRIPLSREPFIRGNG
jgi:hypothetical protein